MKRACLAVCVLGCHGGSSEITVDAPPPDAGFVEATPSSLPQLVTLGGTVLASPKIQPIFFTGDATVQAQIEDFATQLTTSSYWTTAVGEYGVGAPSVLPTLIAPGTAPTTETALLALLETQLDGTHAGWTFDPSTIYSVFLPDGVVLTGSDGSKSCQDYGAYHDEVAGTAQQAIVYALIPRCQGQGPAIDDLTAASSHEWIEAATDPRVESAPAFGDADAAHYIWAYTPGAETGDYCEYLDAAYQRLVGNFLVQRTWSNAAAMAGKDPCVPALDGAYAAAAPTLTEDFTIDGFTGPTMTKGVKVPNGMPTTIDVQLYSDRPTDDITVSATDLAAEFGSPAELTFAWDKTTGKNGDVLHLTITRKRNGSQMPGSEFVVVASLGGSATNMWWSFAGN